jgi:hypothetical protein
MVSTVAKSPKHSFAASLGNFLAVNRQTGSIDSHSSLTRLRWMTFFLLGRRSGDVCLFVMASLECDGCGPILVVEWSGFCVLEWSGVVASF